MPGIQKMGFPPKTDPLDEALAFQIHLRLGLMLPPKERATPLNKDEAMVDMGFQVLPHDSPHAVTGNQNGVPTNQKLEPVIKVMRRCRADLEQHVAGTITDIEKGGNRGSTPMSHCSLEILRLIFKLILVKTMVRNLLVKEAI